MVLGSLAYILALAMSPQAFNLVLAVGSMAFNQVPGRSLAANKALAVWSLAFYMVLGWVLTFNLALADLWSHSLGSHREQEGEKMWRKTGHPALGR